MPDSLIAFETEPAFPDERAWFWKWLVLGGGSLALLLLATLVIFAQAGLLRVPRAWRNPPRKMYRGR